jgi:hypothetical protein
MSFTPQLCPACQVKLGAQTDLTTPDEEPTFGPGTYTLCTCCNTWLRFDDDLKLKKATPAEILQLSYEHSFEMEKAEWIVERLRQKKLEKRSSSN